jgi:hypothetical protein
LIIINSSIMTNLDSAMSGASEVSTEAMWQVLLNATEQEDVNLGTSAGVLKVLTAAGVDVADLEVAVEGYSDVDDEEDQDVSHIVIKRGSQVILDRELVVASGLEAHGPAPESPAAAEGDDAWIDEGKIKFTAEK